MNLWMKVTNPQQTKQLIQIQYYSLFIEMILQISQAFQNEQVHSYYFKFHEQTINQNKKMDGKSIEQLTMEVAIKEREKRIEEIKLEKQKEQPVDPKILAYQQKVNII